MNKRNLPLIIALAIPVLMIGLIAAFIYLPGLGKKPQYNFIYLTGSGYYYYDYNRPQYSVVNGHLVKNEIPINTYQNYYTQPGDPHFYLYDTATHTAKEISFTEAQSYTLDPSTTSPDGYMLERGRGGGDFPFGGPSDYNSWYLKGHNRSTKLNLKIVGPDYYSVQLMGWIK